MGENYEHVETLVLDNWGIFKGMGWYSPSLAIEAYVKNPRKLDQDMVAVHYERKRLQDAESARLREEEAEWALRDRPPTEPEKDRRAVADYIELRQGEGASAQDIEAELSEMDHRGPGTRRLIDLKLGSGKGHRSRRRGRNRYSPNGDTPPPQAED